MKTGNEPVWFVSPGRAEIARYPTDSSVSSLPHFGQNGTLRGAVAEVIR